MPDLDTEGYWLIPQDLYAQWDQEFHFTFDPCPYPRPPAFDGLRVPWGDANWVNPPFKGGITPWIRKAVEEQAAGKTSVLILPLDRWMSYLVRAHAEIRYVGDNYWVHTRTGERRKTNRPSFLFILRGLPL